MFLPTRLFNITGEFLYPAYATYKALGRRPADHGELERWLMYWSLVGAWTAAEGVMGWFLEWIPFYTICKTLLFLYLASASTRGTPYLYNTVLAPLFAEHEPEIDAFIAGLRGRAGEGARGGVGWLWETIRKALGLTQDQSSQLSHAAGVQYPAAVGAQPPTLHDPASGAIQGAYGALSSLASKYLPGALAAMSAAAQSAQNSAGGPSSRSASATASSFASTSAAPAASPRTCGFDVPPPVPPAPVSSAGSRTFQYAAESVFTASVRAHDNAHSRGNSRTNSDGSLSGSASGSNLAASGFAEIRREEAEGADVNPGMGRRTSSNWMRWSTPKDKAE